MLNQSLRPYTSTERIIQHFRLPASAAMSWRICGVIRAAHLNAFSALPAMAGRAARPNLNLLLSQQHRNLRRRYALPTVRRGA